MATGRDVYWTFGGTLYRLARWPSSLAMFRGGVLGRRCETLAQPTLFAGEPLGPCHFADDELVPRLPSLLCALVEQHVARLVLAQVSGARTPTEWQCPFQRWQPSTRHEREPAACSR
jgi:hypothetical protein